VRSRRIGRLIGAIVPVSYAAYGGAIITGLHIVDYDESNALQIFSST
jgi:hypothetical protein